MAAFTSHATPAHASEKHAKHVQHHAPSSAPKLRHSYAITSLIIIACIGGRLLGTQGDLLPTWMRVTGIVGFALVTYIPFIQKHASKAFILLLTLGLFAFAIEHVAIKTCALYGCFSYGNLLGTKILGTVPRTLFFSRTPLVMGVARIVHHVRVPMRCQALIGGIALVLVDMLIDPVAVASGFRSFQTLGPRYDIPAQNFVGWFLSGSVGTYIFLNLLHDAHAEKSLNTDYVWRSFMLTILCFTTTAFTLELWGPAILGSLITVYFGYHLYAIPTTYHD